jgi:hypothetical protein
MELSRGERIVSAQIAGSAAAYGHRRRITADEAADEIRELLTRVPADRHHAVLVDAAAMYTRRAQPGDAETLAVLVGLGVDEAEAAAVRAARHRIDPWHM